jgi:hypothetical protein
MLQSHFFTEKSRHVSGRQVKTVRFVGGFARAGSVTAEAATDDRSQLSGSWQLSKGNSKATNIKCWQMLVNIGKTSLSHWF